MQGLELLGLLDMPRPLGLMGLPRLIEWLKWLNPMGLLQLVRLPAVPEVLQSLTYRLRPWAERTSLGIETIWRSWYSVNGSGVLLEDDSGLRRISQNWVNCFFRIFDGSLLCTRLPDRDSWRRTA